MIDSEIQDYISTFPEKTQLILIELYQEIVSIHPNIHTSISYGMPAFKYKKKPFVYFAGYKNHIGLYATPNTHKVFADKLSKYKQGKGSVQFPLSQPIPFDLIKEMLIFRFEELEK